MSDITNVDLTFKQLYRDPILADVDEIGQMFINLTNGDMAVSYLNRTVNPAVIALRRFDPGEATSARDAAIAARDEARTFRDEAQTALAAVIVARDAAQTSSTQAQGFRDQAETFKNNAETAKSTAEAAQSGALNSLATTRGLKDQTEGFKNTAQAASTASEGFRDEAEGFRDATQAIKDSIPTDTGGGGDDVDLDALARVLPIAPTLGDADNILVTEQAIDGFKNHILNEESLTNLNFLGAGFDNADAPIVNTDFQNYNIIMGENVVSVGLGSNRPPSVDLTNFNSASTTRKVVTAVDIFGEIPNMALLIRSSDKRQIILLSDYNELTIDLRIESGITRADIPATYTESGGRAVVANMGIKDGTRIFPGRYTWNLTVAQANLIFPNLPSLNGARLFLRPRPSTSGGRQGDRVSINLADAWYEAIRSERARKVTTTTLATKVNKGLAPRLDHITQDIEATDARVAALESAAPDTFTALVSGVSFQLTNAESLPAADAIFSVNVFVHGVENAPSGNVAIVFEGSPLTIINQPALSEGFNAIECSMNTATRANILRNTARSGGLDIQLSKGTGETEYSSDIAYIPLHPEAAAQTLWQQKQVPANTVATDIATANAAMAMLNFNSLEIGGTFELDIDFRFSRVTNRNAGEAIVQILNGRTLIGLLSLRLGQGDGSMVPEFLSIPFVASTATIRYNATTITNGASIEATATLRQLPNHSRTTKWN